MTRTRVDCDIRPYEPADEPAVLGLLERALAGGPTGRRSEAFFRWKHVDNPYGPSLAFVAEVDGRLAGFRTFMRWRFAADGGRVRHAVRAVDTATDPAFQGQGIFSRLTRTAIDAIRGEVDFIFNTPNGNSLPGYLKLGWRRVGDVPIRLRPVRLVRFARGARQAVGDAGSRPLASPSPFTPAAEALADGEAVAELLAAAEPSDRQLRTDRTVEYLRWRYGRAPDLAYRAVTARDAAGLSGLAIGRLRTRGPLTEFTLAEVIVRRGDRRAARRLLRTVARAGCDHVATHLSPDTELEAAGRSSGYLKLPGRGMTLVANPLTETSPDPLQPSSWQLSLGDLEVF